MTFVDSNNLRSGKLADLLSVSAIFLFGLLATIRLYPFNHSISEIINGSADDWQLYAQIGIDIKNNGLGISSVAGDYNYPNGFFYNYFLAFCFLIFGENPDAVYIIQSMMAGLSIFLIYRCFRKELSGVFQLILICVLIFFCLADVFKYYTCRFLSENLVLLTLALFFYFLKRWDAKRKLHDLLVSAVFLGLSLMTRPNLLPIACLILAALLLFLLKKKILLKEFIVFFLFLFFSSSLLALRNHAVSGHWTFFPIDSAGYFGKFLLHPAASLSQVLKKIAFCFGNLSAINPDFRWRPHWIFMWAFFFAFLFLRGKIKTFGIFAFLTGLFIFSYLGIMIFVIDTNLISSYGFRYLLPLIFFTLPFAVIGLQKVYEKIYSDKIRR